MLVVLMKNNDHESNVGAVFTGYTFIGWEFAFFTVYFPTLLLLHKI